MKKDVTINDLKVSVFDILAEQESLQIRLQELEKKKEPILTAIKKMMDGEKQKVADPPKEGEVNGIQG